MKHILAIPCILFGVLAVSAQTPQKDAGGYHAPTIALERGRTIFVESSCHFCHGVDLAQTNMGAANLMHSPLVGADVDGNLIGTIVLAGLPNLQTAMPRYKDLTEQQISDLAGYVHYLRQEGKFREIMSVTLPTGDPQVGKALFTGTGGCVSCHTEASLTPLVKQSDPRTLETHLLMPKIAEPKEGIVSTPAAEAHRKFTENASPADVANLLAFLKQLN